MPDESRPTPTEELVAELFRIAEAIRENARQDGLGVLRKDADAIDEVCSRLTKAEQRIEELTKQRNDAYDRLIEEWHRSLTEDDSTPDLHEFMGLTWAQYGEWVENPRAALRSTEEQEAESG